MYSIKTLLPDLFLQKSGVRVSCPDDWRQYRKELLDQILGIEYGYLPPAPTRISGEILDDARSPEFINAGYRRYRVVVEGGQQPFSFVLNVLKPPGNGPFPVALSGDACWNYINEEIKQETLTRSYILATFDRTEIVPDDPHAGRDRALYSVYPDGAYGALAAWAWGYHRCVDVLATLSEVDTDRIAIIGHSRGGKASLLAGATDERIAVTAANNSGCGGAGSFRVQGDGCEKLENILTNFPHWFSPELNQYSGRDEELPFDQHALKALVAPRALITTEALGDLWANPSGTYQTYLAAREAYRFLGAEERIGIWYRDGGHHLGLTDWRAFLDFTDFIFRGAPLPSSFNSNPFPDMTPAFDWSAPV